MYDVPSGVLWDRAEISCGRKHDAKRQQNEK